MAGNGSEWSAKSEIFDRLCFGFRMFIEFCQIMQRRFQSQSAHYLAICCDPSLYSCGSVSVSASSVCDATWLLSIEIGVRWSVKYLFCAWLFSLAWWRRFPCSSFINWYRHCYRWAFWNSCRSIFALILSKRSDRVRLRPSSSNGWISSPTLE